MNEIENHLRPIINNHFELFDLNEKILIPKTNKNSFENNLLKFIQFSKGYLNLMIGKVNRTLNISEIGFSSEMFSIALKKLGHDVYSFGKEHLDKSKANFIFNRKRI